jgi:hypothetical protein
VASLRKPITQTCHACSYATFLPAFSQHIFLFYFSIMTTPSKKPLKHSMRKSIYSSYDSLCSIGRKDSPVVPAAFSLLKTVQLGGSKESAQSAAVRKRKFVADAEDEDSSNSDPPRVLVCGQSITGLLPKEPPTVGVTGKKRGWRVRAEHAKNSLRAPALSSKYCRFKRKKGVARCCDSKRKETNDLVLVVVGT